MLGSYLTHLIFKQPYVFLSCQLKAANGDEAGCYRVPLHAGPILGALSSLTLLATL